MKNLGKTGGLRRSARGRLLASSAAVLALLSSMPATAQDEADDEDDVEEVVITGSRISRSNLTTPTPTTILNAEAIEATGVINLIDALNELPQLNIGFTNENTSFSFGNAGLNQADLRNLGTNRTLTLINGRRAIGAPSDSNAIGVDIGTIPPALIERVEVITGGASAVYGADAVAGVVNLILKEDYEGLSVRAQGGISDEGDAEGYTISALGGVNFGDGRGNLTIGAEYSDAQGLFFRDRPNAGGSVRFIGNPENTGPEDGIPDQIQATGLRFARFGIPSTTVEFFRNLDGTPANVNNVFSFDNSGNAFLAIPGDELIDGFLTRNEFGGPPGFTDRARVPLSRYNAYAKFRYEIFEDIEFNLQTRYSRTESGDQIGPVFAILAGIDTISADNPFVPDSLRTILEGDPTTTDDDISSFRFSRQFNDFGPRASNINREFFSISTGFEGEINDNWNWEVYYQYGGTTTSNTALNDRLDERYVQALDAIVDPDSGDIVCRDQSNGCVPLNPFVGPGQVDPAAVDFVTTDHTSITRNEQQLVSGSVAGDLFEVPAGNVGLAVGAEYRRDSIDSRPSFVFENGLGFFASQLSPIEASTDVKEAFAEVIVPLVKDVPFVEYLAVEGAVRLADYSNAGTNTSWKVGGEWQPIPDIRLRGVYSRAVRAPSLGELFDPGRRGASGLTDPCDALNVNANENRARNCAALGIPTDFVSAGRSVTTLVFSTGNPNLDVERADTLTLGVIFTPSFLPDFNFTADYYDIDLNGGITRFGAQTTLNQCHDLPDLNNNFCEQVTRGPDLNVFEVGDTFINASGFRVRGVDFEANYSFDLDEAFGTENGGRLRFNLVGSYLKDLEFVQIAADADSFVFENAGESGDPQWRVNLNTTYTRGPLTLNWQARFTSSVLNNNEDSDEFRFPNSIPSTVFNDFRASYDLKDNVNLFLGIDNVFDKAPPLHPFTASGGFFGLTGRFVYAGLQIDL